MIADTVGFHPRAASRSRGRVPRDALAEARDADLLIHVSDAADEERELLARVVNSVLEEIGAGARAAAFGHEQGRSRRYRSPGGPRRRRQAPAGLRRRRPGRAWMACAWRWASCSAVNASVPGLSFPLSAGRLHARLKAAGAIASEAVDELGWHLDIDAPRSVLAPLVGDDAHSASLRELIGQDQAEH